MSDYQVLFHPELGHFPDEDSAVAAAWTITPPGLQRPKVIPTGAQQVSMKDPPEWEHGHDPCFYPDQDFVRPRAEPHGLAHSVQDIHKGVMTKILTHCGQVFIGDAATSVPSGWKKCQACRDIRTSVYVPGARVSDNENSEEGFHIVERSTLHRTTTWVQFHCARVAPSTDLRRLDFEVQFKTQCSSCFDKTSPCPPAPIGW